MFDPWESAWRRHRGAGGQLRPEASWPLDAGPHRRTETWRRLAWTGTSKITVSQPIPASPVHSHAATGHATHTIGRLLAACVYSVFRMVGLSASKTSAPPHEHKEIHVPASLSCPSLWYPGDRGPSGCLSGQGRLSPTGGADAFLFPLTPEMPPFLGFYFFPSRPTAPRAGSARLGKPDVGVLHLGSRRAPGGEGRGPGAAGGVERRVQR